MKAVLFKERVKGWAINNGIIISDIDYIEKSGFYYIDVKQPVLYWRELRRLEEICNNMGIEIYDIIHNIDFEDKKDIYTIWIA